MKIIEVAISSALTFVTQQMLVSDGIVINKYQSICLFMLIFLNMAHLLEK